MKREEYCCIIGYQGEEALVDKSALKQVKSSSVNELAEKGLYRAAMAAALFEEDEDAQKLVLSLYREKASAPVDTPEQLVRMLGIYPAFKENIKVKLI